MPESSQPSDIPSLDNLSSWVIDDADTVRDMGRRVAEVLERQPHDFHYAYNKLWESIDSAANAITYARAAIESRDQYAFDGMPPTVDALQTLVRDAYNTAEGNLR